MDTLNAAPDEFVSEYSVPRIITQYQRSLLSTRDYPDFRDYYSLPGIIRYQMGTVLSLALIMMPSTLDYELSAKTKKMVQVLLDFKANWREFYDHFYFRDLTSNRRRLGK